MGLIHNLQIQTKIWDEIQIWTATKDNQSMIQVSNLPKEQEKDVSLAAGMFKFEFFSSSNVALLYVAE